MLKETDKLKFTRTYLKRHQLELGRAKPKVVRNASLTRAKGKVFIEPLEHRSQARILFDWL